MNVYELWTLYNVYIYIGKDDNLYIYVYVYTIFNYKHYM